MEYTLSKESASLFEGIKHIDDNGNEYWYARELMPCLGYAQWRRFEETIEKAKEACKTATGDVLLHFADAGKSYQMPNGGTREIVDYRLSRYACYLIAQNGDPRKSEIAEAQTYFAIQTRYAEIRQMEEYQHLTTEEEMRLFLRRQMKEHNSQLAEAAKNAGVREPWEYARFQNAGYRGLYNGMDEDAIHRHKGLAENQRILDHMGSTELAANLFRATQAEEKLRKENVRGKSRANAVHYDVGVEVRKTIERIGGTMPEDLPSVESIKTVEKKQRLIGKSKRKKTDPKKGS